VGFEKWMRIGVEVVCINWMRWKKKNIKRKIKVNIILKIV
jgi:hypothetical protein